MGAITIITERYDKLVVIKGIDQSSLPVFQQNWWVEIARGSARYVEAQVFDDGVVVGNLPYIERTNTLGITWVVSPHWSYLGGPVVSQALNDEKKENVLRQLIAQLPRKALFIFEFTCRSNENDSSLIRQAFINAGFKHSRKITYLRSPEDADVMSRLNSKHRSHIKSADKKLEVIEIGADEFTSFYEANLRAAGLISYAPLNVARDLIAKGQEGDAPQVRVIAARKRKEGSPYDAAVACTWDRERYYLWLSSRRVPSDYSSQDKPHPDAIKLLIIKATEHAQSLGRIFDVAGFATQGQKKLYREILKVPNKEFLDVFDRTAGLARLFVICRPKIKKAAGFLGFHK
jgi:hypothetical protein